jgi:ubiquitin-conjugating enzyme E2 D/E
MLGDANPDDPFNSDAGRLYRNNRSEFDKKAREWTRLYAN